MVFSVKCELVPICLTLPLVHHSRSKRQEEELAVIRRRQATFARERDAEMAEVQRMEAEAKRKSAEKWVLLVVLRGA